MADQKALAALQPFILLAKGAGPAKAADIITRATEAPGCYVFSELLELESIQRLNENEEYAKYYHLLRIFAYGSYTDYLSSSYPLPPLTDAQLHKLKQLSLVTLSSQPPASLSLSYPYLLKSLSLPTARALEDLVISSIYASLLDAKLDTANQRVEVSSAAGRDVADEEIPGMIKTLGNWAAQCEDVLRDIEGQVEEIQRIAVERRKEREEYEKEVAAKRDALAKKDGPGGPGGGAGSQGGQMGKGKRVISDGDEGLPNEDLMDIDEDAGSQAAGGGSGLFGFGGSQGGRRRKGVKVANKRR
ncbi:hypothetical protein BDZ91DRAFT_708975 [Kalaharituber pfeilii]|nr:hypothetical protein BDZ91DRAFT_708975 [Kalaharituber pfeilii]